MILDEKSMQLITKNKTMKLTLKEFKILSFLIENKYRVCFYKELVLYVYSDNGINEENYKYYKSPLVTTIKRFSKKIKDEDIKIITVNNYGFLIKYNIDKEIKKRINGYEIRKKIIQLKNEIYDKETEIKLLEDKLNER